MSSVRSSTVGKLSETEPTLYPQTVIFLVCEELGVSPIALLTDDRHRPLPTARHLVAWLLYRWEGYTMREIAKVLGVDESTVGYYLQNVKAKIGNGEWGDLTFRLVKQLASAGQKF